MFNTDCRTAVRKYVKQAVCIHFVRLLNTNQNFDLHRFFGKAEEFCHINGIMPKRILQATAGGLRIILPAQACAKAKFSQNAMM